MSRLALQNNSQINIKKIDSNSKDAWQQLLETKTEHVLQESLQILRDQCSLFAKVAYEKLLLQIPSTENSDSFASCVYPFNQKNSLFFPEDLLPSLLADLRRQLNSLNDIILPGDALSSPPPFFHPCTLEQAMQEELFTLTVSKWAEKKNKQAFDSSLQKAFFPAPSVLLKLALKAVRKKISPGACFLNAAGCSHSQEKSRCVENKKKRLLGISKRWEHQLYHYWEKQLVDYIYAQHEDLANNLF